MAKNPLKQTMNRKKPEEITGLLARKHGRSIRYVQMVISGSTEKNYNSEKAQAILADYLDYQQKHNLLLKEVIRIVPFYSN